MQFLGSMVMVIAVFPALLNSPSHGTLSCESLKIFELPWLTLDIVVLVLST